MKFVRLCFPEIETQSKAISYDALNRLVGYANPTTTATYAYDALDRRVAKTVDGAITSYVYDTSMEDPLAFDDITLEFDSTASPILKRRWMSDVSAHGTVLHDCVAEGLRLILTLDGVEDDEETRDDEGAC